MSTTIDCSDAGSDFISPTDAVAAFETLRRLAPNHGLSGSEWDCSNGDDCTYETQETDEVEETQESQETEELEETKELTTLGPKLSMVMDKAISECGVLRHGDVNRPLFMLAHKLRSIEEELNDHFSIDVIAEAFHRWKEHNDDHLEDDHDYLAEFLDKLSLVRFPRGRALLRALEIARNVEPPKQTAPLSADVQLLASLCRVLQQQADKKPFFLDGRAAAKALGKPHETVASWLRALRQLRIIKRVSKGIRGTASRYLYVAQKLTQTVKR
jgi:hypothetical protein